MKLPKWLRNPRWAKFHRWLGLIIGLQMLLWAAGGLVFTWSDIDNVHGDFEKKEQVRPLLEKDLLGPGAARAVRALSDSLGRKIQPRRILLTYLLDRPVYAVYEKGGVPAGLADARNGKVLTPLGEAHARSLARADFKHEHPILSAELLKETPNDYRGSERPVWRIAFDTPKNTRLYISPLSGRVLARRNWNWRLFDFFWMLHTMDYWERDDFNHPLIKGASVLVCCMALTGLALVLERFLRPLLAKKG